MGERADGKWEPFHQDSTEGNEAAKGILLSEVDPTDGEGGVGSDVQGVVIERLAEVRASDLIWPSDVTTAEQDAATAELLARNIKLRQPPSRVETQTT
jgi:hypothetical protein